MKENVHERAHRYSLDLRHRRRITLAITAYVNA
jgi:hypothetical protein